MFGYFNSCEKYCRKDIKLLSKYFVKNINRKNKEFLLFDTNYEVFRFLLKVKYLEIDFEIA